MKLGELLRKIAYEGNLRQREIADYLGIQQGSVSKLKNSKQFPSLKTSQRIVSLAKKYKINIRLEDIKME